MDQHNEVDVRPTVNSINRTISGGSPTMSSGSSAGNVNILFMGFNQDGTSLAVGTRHGYRLYQIHSADKIELIFESTTEKDVCLVERLFSSSLVALASLNSPRMLKVIHFKKNTEICNYSYSNTVLAVRMNRNRLIVCLEETLYIHNIRNMEVLHTIRDTPSNPHGLCALVPNDECSYLAYPGSSIIGEVQIFDANHLRAVTMLAAHNTTLASMAFDYTGTRLATASDKGTVIRVFAVPSGDKLYEFRRGMRRCVTIYSLGFSSDGALLCSSSNTETLHIFKLDSSSSLASGGSSKHSAKSPSRDEGHEKSTATATATAVGGGGSATPQTTGGWMMSYLNKAISSTSNYLPTQVAEVINQGRSFAQVRHAVPGIRNTSCITVMQKMPRLLVVTAEGYLYVYGIDPVDGGDCNLLRQHNLFNIPLTTTPASTASTSSGGGSEAALDKQQPLAARQAAELEKQTPSPPTVGRRKSTSSSSSSLNQQAAIASANTRPVVDSSGFSPMLSAAAGSTMTTPSSVHNADDKI